MKQPSPVWKFLQVIGRVGTTLMFDLKVYGSHRVPREGGILLVSNHQSYLDPVLLGVRLPRTLSYMAKARGAQGSRLKAQGVWLVLMLWALALGLRLEPWALSIVHLLSYQAEPGWRNWQTHRT